MDNFVIDSMSPSLFEKHVDVILKFCRTISCSVPIWLPTLTDSQKYNSLHRSYDCHINVEHWVQQRKGTVISGWLIRIIPERSPIATTGEIFIDAEHHSVWKTEDGPDSRYVDITPKHSYDGFHRLFLPDLKRAHGYFSGREWCNRNNDPERRFSVNGEKMTVEHYDLSRSEFDLYQIIRLGLVSCLEVDVIHHYDLIEQINEKLKYLNNWAPTTCSTKTLAHIETMTQLYVIAQNTIQSILRDSNNDLSRQFMDRVGESSEVSPYL